MKKVRHPLQLKLILIYLLVIMLLFGWGGFTLAHSYDRELIGMRDKALVTCAEDIAMMYRKGEISILPGSSNETEPVLITTAKDFDATILIANADTQNVNYVIDRETFKWVSYSAKVDPAIIQTIVQDGKEYYLRSNYYNEEMKARVSTLAYPVKLYTGQIFAILIINSDLKNVSETYHNIVSSLLVPILAVFACGLIFILLITNKIVKRVILVNNGTEEIAKGHFDNRIQCSGHDEVSALADGFNHMAEQLETSDEIKRDFTSNVAHELRSPMTSIHGFVEGMLDGTIPQEEFPKYLEIVNTETNRLIKLIQEMLSLSRIESGREQLTLNKVDVNELLRRVLIRLMQKIENGGIIPEIQLDEKPVYVSADGDKIEQVVQNLLDNAIKFTPPGRKIFVSTVTENGKVLVTIRDEGIGISQEHIKHIWERFYTVNKARSGVTSGTGLGLPIVKKIIELHGENIQVDSVSGEGTTFTFTLKPYKK